MEEVKRVFCECLPPKQVATLFRAEHEGRRQISIFCWPEEWHIGVASSWWECEDCGFHKTFNDLILDADEEDGWIEADSQGTPAQ